MSRRRPIPAVTAPLDEPCELAPPRFPWIRRFAVALLLVWLLMGVTWFTLLKLADRGLRAEVAAAKARGEPLMLADFTSPVTRADESNAVVHLLRAAEADRENPKETGENWEELRTVPLTAEAIAILRPHIAANKAALAAVRAARECPSAEWGLLDPAVTSGEREGRFMENLRDLGRVRELAERLQQAAFLASADGDDAAAMGYVLDLLAVARAVDQSGTLIGHMVTTGGMEAMASNAAMEVAKGLRVARAGDRAAVDAVLRALLDDPPRVERARRAMFAERARILAADDRVTLRWERRPAGELFLASIPFHERLVESLVEPHARRQLAVNVKHLGVAAAAMRLSDWPAARATLPPPLPPMRAIKWYDIPHVAWLRGSDLGLQRIVQYDATNTATRRMAAVLLAVRLYQINGGGQLPTKIEELRSGGYLPVVPTDPYATGGKLIGYGRTGTTCFVYSVYTDGIDDVAAGWTPRAGDHNHGQTADRVWFLDPRAASAAPATTPAVMPTPAASQTETTPGAS
jgi:hypothetical protein